MSNLPMPSAKPRASEIALSQIPDVRTLLGNRNAASALQKVAASHMRPERMMRLVANALRTTPKLAQCNPMSLLGALMQCASLGLEPNTIMGHAYLIPFDKRAKNPKSGQWEVVGTDVQLVVGYRGLVDLAYRSGRVKSISANIHYSDDDLWEYEEGTEAMLRHRPGNLQGEKLHAYAVAKFKDGGDASIVLPWARVMSIRDNSEGWKSATRLKKTADTPWGKYEDEMAKKTAIRALAKMLPLSIEFVEAVQVDSSRADFAAFAATPDSGLAIEAFAHDGDGEGLADEDEEKPADEQETAPAKAQASAPQRKPRAKADEPQPEADDGQAAADLADAIEAKVGDAMEDGATVEQALELVEADTAKLLAMNPGAHAALMARVAAFEDQA